MCASLIVDHFGACPLGCVPADIMLLFLCRQMEETALQELNLRKQELLSELRSYEKTIESVRVSTALQM